MSEGNCPVFHKSDHGFQSSAWRVFPPEKEDQTNLSSAGLYLDAKTLDSQDQKVSVPCDLGHLTMEGMVAQKVPFWLHLGTQTLRETKNTSGEQEPVPLFVGLKSKTPLIIFPVCNSSACSFLLHCVASE